MAGNASSVILAPPVNISREEIHVAVKAIDAALVVADAEVAI